MKTTHRTDCFRIILALAAFALTAVPSHAQETLTDADVAALRAELDGRADEDERQLLFAQGLDELNNERFEKAEHFVREAIKKGLQNQHSYFTLGTALREQKKHGDAGKAYEYAAQFCLDNANLHQCLAYAAHQYMTAGDRRNATRCAQAAVDSGADLEKYSFLKQLNILTDHLDIAGPE